MDAVQSLSLVVSTLGRSAELPRLFRSIADQSVQPLEVIVVDQNTDDRVAAAIAGDWPFAVRHIRTPGERGLSRGRNHGIRQAEGRVILFPDDDCWYPPTLFAKGLRVMHGNRADIACGRAADESGNTINGRFEEVAQLVTRRNVWSTQIEWVVFFTRQSLLALGGFDENVGVGAASPWQACEGQEIMLRALAAGFRAYYDPELFGHHARFGDGLSAEARRRKARMYARGMGWVMRKHNFGVQDALYWTARPLARLTLHAVAGNWSAVAHTKSIAAGRIEGFLGYPLST